MFPTKQTNLAAPNYQPCASVVFLGSQVHPGPSTRPSTNLPFLGLRLSFPLPLALALSRALLLSLRLPLGPLDLPLGQGLDRLCWNPLDALAWDPLERPLALGDHLRQLLLLLLLHLILLPLLLLELAGLELIKDALAHGSLGLLALALQICGMLLGTKLLLLLVLLGGELLLLLGLLGGQYIGIVVPRRGVRVRLPALAVVA